MFRSVQNDQEGSGDGPVVDIASLIDVVFILLIFFLVTSTFVKDTVLEVRRAQASSATSTQRVSMRVSITAAGHVFTEGVEVDLEELGRRVERSIVRDELRSVVVIPDRDVPAGRLVEVMDRVRAAGMYDIAVAAERWPR